MRYISVETTSQLWFEDHLSWKQICLEAEEVLEAAGGRGELYYKCISILLLTLESFQSNSEDTISIETLYITASLQTWWLS